MNAWQMARQLRFVLASRVWSEAGGEKVLASAVVVSAVFDALFNSSRNKPVLGIKAAGGIPDAETRGYLDQTFDLLLVVDVTGDDLGEHSVIGAGRISGKASSKGRGLLEIEEEVKSAIRGMIAQGFRITTLTDGDSDALNDENGRYLAYRTYSVMARTTEDRYYHPPRNLLAAGGVGSVSLAWVLPPLRFDRRRVILRRASGSTPPASPTAGVDVPLAGLLDVAVVDSGLAPGTYSYAIFAAYDETGSGTDERFSAQEVGTVRAGVVVT